MSMILLKKVLLDIIKGILPFRKFREDASRKDFITQLRSQITEASHRVAPFITHQHCACSVAPEARISYT